MTETGIPIAVATDREDEIVRGVYWAEGTIMDHGQLVEVPEWHYHWLNADGIALGHGDGYLSEEHVVAAMQGVLEDFEAEDVPVAEGKPGSIDPRDAAQGRFSQTGSAHCENGHKVPDELIRLGSRIQQQAVGCPMCGTAVPTGYEGSE